jgi:adenine-specific DNA-methyltransferase
MTEFDKKLKDLLKKDLRFVDEDTGELLRNEIVTEALNFDKALISLLLSDKSVKSKFFTEIKGHWIFEINKFNEYIQDKKFLSDSYTKFQNKIGLNIDGKFLSERGEVALVWPFKDCVLEGGMTKESQKRKEIFFNETLAQDEIDRLFDPKVLTNFTRYSAKGKAKVKNIKRDENGIIKENLIIKGNNLLVLHSLKKQFQNKVKLIYIDPPYNTGNDSFSYNDSFNHSAWLTFMKNRLEVAKDLLREDGVIFVQCDDNETAYLKVLMDNIFGVENNQVTLFIQVRYGQKTLSEKNDYQKLIEQIHVYSKRNFLPNRDKEKYTIDKFEWEIKEIASGTKIKLGKRDAVMFKDGEYQITKVKPSMSNLKETWASGTVLKVNASGKFFKNYISQRYKIDGHKVLYKVTGIGEDGMGYRYFTGPKKEGATRGKFYSGIPTRRRAELEAGESFKFRTIDNFYNYADSFGNCRHEGGVELRSGKKPEILLKRILDIATQKEDIVLDFFMGTGVSCAVAHKMGRQYIGVEQLDYDKNDSIIRLNNVIKGDQSGISKAVSWKNGGGFIYCELMKYNEKAIDKIQSAKSKEALLKMWKEMCDTYFLNYDVKINDFNDNQDTFKKLPLEKQKKLLVGMLNKNQLYVNLSEIEDSQFKVSKEEKEMNKEFYK